MKPAAGIKQASRELISQDALTIEANNSTLYLPANATIVQQAEIGWLPATAEDRDRPRGWHL
jgi:hypothetical protein